MSYKEQNSLDCIKINQELGELCIEFEKKLAEREWVSVDERLPDEDDDRIVGFFNTGKKQWYQMFYCEEGKLIDHATAKPLKEIESLLCWTQFSLAPDNFREWSAGKPPKNGGQDE